MNTTIEALPVPVANADRRLRRMGASGRTRWAATTVTGLSKNRADNTVVHLSFETGGQGRRVAGELYWRKAELKGNDKPRPRAAESMMDIFVAAMVEMART
jgi:hypothetical protein